ncbi:MAG: AAA family ATPase, partial [Gemmatales bacterium]|nr:AAA family ATPase [Gemmatales bacterium]MDW8174389.1 AAA family ATPase [Gemmatales bacterium]
LTLGPVNVLIGANGSGKSNLISLFKMLNRMMNEELQLHVAQSGGPDQLLHYGRKTTQSVHIGLWFRRDTNLANGYNCRLVPAEDHLLIACEQIYFHDRSRYEWPYLDKIHSGIFTESQLPQWASESGGIARYVFEAMQSWQVYHFHDTSDAARVKQMGDILENRHLLPDAGNLAAYLYLLREKHPQRYRNIVETIRLAAPFFGDFILRPHPFNAEKIRLEWRERGSDLTFSAGALSDGTLRFICLATLFLQPPENLPATIVLDEPELGLHPYAIVLLAEMVHSVAQHTQVILATQSVPLVNQFAPEEILVLDRPGGVSTIRRLEQAEIAHWLDEYGLGDLWEKNVLGGRPAL